MDANEQIKIFAKTVAFYGWQLEKVGRDYLEREISRAKFLLRLTEIENRLIQAKRELNRFIGATQ